MRSFSLNQRSIRCSSFSLMLVFLLDDEAARPAGLLDLVPGQADEGVAGAIVARDRGVALHAPGFDLVDYDQAAKPMRHPLVGLHDLVALRRLLGRIVNPALAHVSS